MICPVCPEIFSFGWATGSNIENGVVRLPAVHLPQQADLLFRTVSFPCHRLVLSSAQTLTLPGSLWRGHVTMFAGFRRTFATKRERASTGFESRHRHPSSLPPIPKPQAEKLIRRWIHRWFGDSGAKWGARPTTRKVAIQLRTHDFPCSPESIHERRMELHRPQTKHALARFSQAVQAARRQEYTHPAGCPGPTSAGPWVRSPIHA